MVELTEKNIEQDGLYFFVFGTGFNTEDEALIYIDGYNDAVTGCKHMILTALANGMLEEA
jgi:hypothetical protein